MSDFSKLILLLLFCCVACQEEQKVKVEATPIEGPAYSKIPGKLGWIHRMQGRWKDHRIKGAELLITGNKFVSIYKDEVRNRATIEVFEKCPKLCRKKKRKKGLAYFVVHREDGDYCYTLDRLDQYTLAYTPME